ncbi:MAG: nitrogenase component 1, partial [Desulfitobacterium hafniense]
YKPQIIGVMSSGLTETYGDDMASALTSLRLERPDLKELPVVLAGTPDYIGSMQDGYQRTVEALVATLAGHDFQNRESLNPVSATKIDSEEVPYLTLLPGCHLTPADVDELKEIVGDFGFRPITLPDLSVS